MQTAVEQAVMEGIAHLSGVRFCLNRLLDPTPASQLLTTLPHPRLAQVGQAALSLPQYDQLLTQVRA